MDRTNNMAMKTANLPNPNIGEVTLVGSRPRMPKDQDTYKETLAAPTVRLTTLTRRGQGGMLPGNVTDVLPLDVTPLYPGFSNNTKK